MSTMNKIRLALVAIAAFAAFAMYVQYVGSTEALVERFPDVDPDLVRKISAEMTKESLAGKYKNTPQDDATYDAIFKIKVQEYTK